MMALSTPVFLFKRLRKSWMLPASVLIGVGIATTLGAMAPTFFTALERLALNLEIDKLQRPRSNINLDLFNLPLVESDIDATERAVVEAITDNIQHVYERHERYLIADDYLAGIPRNPLPEAGSSGRNASRATMRSYSNLREHVVVIEGEMPGNKIEYGPIGPIVDAIISEASVEVFGLAVGDEVVMTRELGADKMVTVRISGIIRAIDPLEDYWTPLIYAGVFLDPPTELPEVEGQDVQFNPHEPPVRFLVTKSALLDSIGEAYPGALVDSLWFIMIDAERLKDWSGQEVHRRISGLGTQVRGVSPGTKLNTAILGVLERFQRRSFFTRLPLLLLVTILLATVLFYLSVIVSYLVRSRESDSALLKTRGTKFFDLVRMYSMEGALITTFSVVVGPLVAIVGVALLGKLPYFSSMTHGSVLPVHVAFSPFLASIGIGAVCFLIFVFPAVLRAQDGLLVHKLRSSRAPSVSFFHRYYLDVGLLVVGGLVFWEFQSRGHFVSGGLFKGLEVNEALLLAPIMFLVVVALLFLRVFPTVVRFVSGESPLLVHLLVVVTIGILAPVLALSDIRDGNTTAWLEPVGFLAIVVVGYWWTYSVEMGWQRIAGLFVQVMALVGFLRTEPPQIGDSLLWPILGLIVLIPAQLLFVMLKKWKRAIPVWILIGMWHMARDPLQYSWLVLLLVMVTGVAILSTTVGGTLVKSQTERVLYDLATDVRSDIARADLQRGRHDLKDRVLSIQGVADASLGLRTSGEVGSARVEVLALDSGFSHITWYRADFSASPVAELMNQLTSDTVPRAVLLPDNATRLGLWVKVDEGMVRGPNLWVVVEDSTGTIRSLVMGRALPSEKWSLKTASLPELLKPPVRLVSVQISEPGFGAVHTPGFIMVDDIHAIGPDGKEVLEGFEEKMEWTAIITSPLSSDLVEQIYDSPHGGTAAALFTFGKENIHGVRGFYHETTEGPLPVIVSSELAELTGVAKADVFLASIAGRRISVVVSEVIDYFPTTGAQNGRFMITDLDMALSRLNTLGGLTLPLGPNELFLAARQMGSQPVGDSIVTSGLLGSNTKYRDIELKEVRQDPLSSAGWSAMALMALCVAVLAATFGYVTYILLFARRSRNEMAFLKSLGLSRGQMLGLLSFEHLSIAAIGLALGTWAGFKISRLMVSSVAVTETGHPLMPPFILTTDWGMMVPAYGALLVIFLAALVITNRSVIHFDLQTVSRMESF